MQMVVAWITTAIVFAGVDAVWLSQMGPRLYKPVLGEILAPKPDLTAAVIFYLIYVTGLVLFVVAPALERGGLMKAVVMGALLGLMAYATYDLTNQATLRVWDWKITVIDLCWGAFVSAVSCAAAYMIASRVTS
ncbi:DUF2177 family protein [Brevundimonas sp. 2R-24]|uniref:DUF2177 family protein n=1 Tax=Peiella sedimenti TaxID=3061083 RepID=A0ABT8SLT9_9CAUL|nr:DUF2177 family protein [Caulobacteraceae bacterium XZ-24]